MVKFTAVRTFVIDAASFAIAARVNTASTVGCLKDLTGSLAHSPAFAVEGSVRDLC